VVKGLFSHVCTPEDIVTQIQGIGAMDCYGFERVAGKQVAGYKLQVTW
jgi:hypothetical protein